MEATMRSPSGFRAPQACPARATVRPRVGPETWQQHSGRQRGAPAPPPRVGPLRAPASRGHGAGAPGNTARGRDATRSLGGRWPGLPCYQKPQKVLLRRGLCLPCKPPGAGSRGCALAAGPACGSARVPAQPPHPAARERLPSAAQPPCAAGPHWLGQPGPAHGRPRPREAPPLAPFALLTPLVPSRYPAPGRFKLVKCF